MTTVVPNTASTLSSAASVVNSANRWAWIGLQTLTSSGCCTWYSAGSPVSGSELMAISLVAQQSAIFGPFNSPCGLYAASVSGGCALVWLKYP